MLQYLPRHTPTHTHAHVESAIYKCHTIAAHLPQKPHFHFAFTTLALALVLALVLAVAQTLALVIEAETGRDPKRDWNLILILEHL